MTDHGLVMNISSRKTFTIEGDAIDDIPTFYDEINRVFMAQEDWALGASLDALNDLFYGDFGAIDGVEPVTLIWRNIERSRSMLGLAATLDNFRAKLAYRDIYDRKRIESDIEALEAGTGLTYFQVILEIIADHPNIELLEG